MCILYYNFVPRCHHNAIATCSIESSLLKVKFDIVLLRPIMRNALPKLPTCYAPLLDPTKPRSFQRPCRPVPSPPPIMLVGGNFDSRGDEQDAKHKADKPSCTNVYMICTGGDPLARGKLPPTPQHSIISKHDRQHSTFLFSTLSSCLVYQAQVIVSTVSRQAGRIQSPSKKLASEKK